MGIKARKEDRRSRLARRFRKQQAFSTESSPLAACLCGVVADRLDANSGNNALSRWLVGASRDCSSFAVPMLLLAGIHREILGGNAEFAALGTYFPTVGGIRPLDREKIAAELERLILANREKLARFLAKATVQTNETSRGLCWLLPLLYVPWPEIVLVDLGCSAGLNLVADLRHYLLQDRGDGRQNFTAGKGDPPQFVLSAQGVFVPPEQQRIPRIRMRLGCDLHPFALASKNDELTLASFVWGDQVQRMARLKEGIAALHQVQKWGVPLHLAAADLPAELPAYLKDHFASPSSVPIVLYNTYLTPYLGDKGASLKTIIEHWARTQTQPVLWLQWELPKHGVEPPELGWLEWTAQLWHKGEHRKWHLAWVHPHGLEVRWLPELTAWAEFFRLNRDVSA